MIAGKLDVDDSEGYQNSMGNPSKTSDRQRRERPVPWVEC